MYNQFKLRFCRKYKYSIERAESCLLSSPLDGDVAAAHSDEIVGGLVEEFQLHDVVLGILIYILKQSKTCLCRINQVLPAPGYHNDKTGQGDDHLVPF